MSYGAQKSHASVGMTHSELGNVVVRPLAHRILKRCFYERRIFRVNGVPKTVEYQIALVWLKTMQTINFVRQVEHLLCVEIGRPTTDVGEALCFGEVRFFASQLLRQQLLLGDVHRGAAVSLKPSIFYDLNADAPDVPNLAIGTNYPVRDIAAAVLLME